MAEVKIDIGALNALTDKAARGGLRAALGEAETIMKDDVLNRQGTGRKYGSHTASAPGDPPAKDTGNLSANTNADSALREDGDTLSGSVVSNSEYAEAMEKGSKHTAKSRTADALFGMQGRYGPARLTALASEVGTERTAARPFLSRLGTEFSGRLASAFVRGAKQ